LSNTVLKVLLGVSVIVTTVLTTVSWQENSHRRQADAVEAAQKTAPISPTRPEQRKTDHDRSPVFMAANADPSSPVFRNQPKGGRITGFDFYRDPLNADQPFAKFEDIMKKESSSKTAVMNAQMGLLQSRYNLVPKLDPEARMSRGKPLPLRPTAKLAQNMTWDQLAQLRPEDIRQRNLFPYLSLPHPLQANGGQVFPKMQIDMSPRLERFDVEFDLPDAFIPEFPPAIFLTNRPELGDVSRGEVVSINNYYRLFKDILTPVQLDGLRLLLTPFPQEEFNPTEDRKSPEPSLGVTCLDCHVNGHTTGQFHLNPDIRPQERRFRVDTVSLRGLQNQQVHGSKRSLRSVEDFTEFEQRTAYFNGDEIHAIKKGMNILDRIQVSHMAQMQNMFDFPPAAKLDAATGRLIRERATESELRGEAVFFGKGQCSQCHVAPFYLDNELHDLHLERFMKAGRRADQDVYTTRD